MYRFLAIIVQMGHNQKDMLKAPCSTTEQFSMLFSGKIMKQGRFYHILRFLHFSDNKTDLIRQMTDCGK
jgi:hypothetical protein